MPDLLHATRIDELIVRSILDHIDPELILLGGSRAWGTPDDESDYDLMLVMRDARSVDTADREARTALRAAGIRAISGLDAACTLLMRLLPKSRYPELPEPTPDEARAAMSAAQDAHVLLLPFCR